MARNKIYLPHILLSLALIIVFSCKTRQSDSVADNDDMGDRKDSLFVSLDRSPCFGSCPTFVVYIYKSGYAIYEGKNAVTRIGQFETRFSKQQLQLFTNAAMEYRIDTLASEHVNPYIADFPASYSSVVLKGKRHSFHISTDTPPPSLTEFEKSVERLIEIPVWTKIEDKK